MIRDGLAVKSLDRIRSKVDMAAQSFASLVRCFTTDWPVSIAQSPGARYPGGHVVRRWGRARPMASVIIPCHNYGIYLMEAVDSALAQTLCDIEIIVVDDGSSDEQTLRVLNHLERPRTKLLRQANTGLPGARNTGIKSSQGKYICCLDADDTLEETYIEKATVLLESRPDLGFVYPWVRRFGKGRGTWEPQDFRLSDLLHFNHVSVSGVFRRKAWDLDHAR